MLIAGCLGLMALKYVAAWKLSTESIDSPEFTTRWLYRYLIFSFFFLISFLFITPFMALQLFKISGFLEFGRNHSWLIFSLNIPPAALLYYLHRKFVIRFDRAKIKGRKKLRAKLASQDER
jgi:hypothetical protein